jgi:ATP-dependent Clp protease ATP-binding subunit ClpA
VRSRGSRSTVRGGGADTFERFTERARQVVVLAQDEARALGHGHIGTEHLFLGLIREGEGLAARVLATLDVTLEAARARVEELDGRGESPPTGQIPFTPNAKKSLELALRQALSFRHNYIGTEHILLGVAAASPERLADFGLVADQVKVRVVELLGGRATDAMWDYQLDTLAPGTPVDPLLEELTREGWEILNIRVERRRKR